MRRLLLILIALPALAHAQEFTTSEGPLSDDDFYRAITCAAPPGGECQKPFVRWERANPIRIAVRKLDTAYLGGKKWRADASLERAIQHINRADSPVRVIEVDPEDTAEIEIFFLDIERGGTITGTGNERVDGTELGGATTRIVFRRETGFIQSATIVFSTTLDIRAYESVMLEEVTQALGLMTDIRNPYYEGRSIFSQDSNASKTLGEQDIMALKRHYAGPGQ